MAEALFWSVLDELRRACPSFAMHGRRYCGIPRRFKRVINVVDSSTIQLMANCLDWAKHQRRKAAAKMHLRLNLQSFLPEFVVVKSAGTNDLVESYELCAGVRSGEIVVFDKAYVGFEHLYRLTERGVFWVTRAKENMQYEIVGQHSEPGGNIIRDVYIKLRDFKTSRKYPATLRLVEAIVEIDNNPRVMVFITNNMKWAPSSICDLYKSRWGIEVFFKEIKQTLQLADLWDTTRTRCAGRYGSPCWCTYCSASWPGKADGSNTFTRLFTVVRGVLWSSVDLFSVLDCCGQHMARQEYGQCLSNAIYPDSRQVTADEKPTMGSTETPSN